MHHALSLAPENCQQNVFAQVHEVQASIALLDYKHGELFIRSSC